MIFSEEDLLKYIANRSYLCPWCRELQAMVADQGLSAIDNYKGMICASIEDMKIRKWEHDTGREWEPHPMINNLWGD